MPTPRYGQPRYRTIADELRRQIEDGLISIGTLLPTEGDLMVEFKASRGTVRQALAVLRKDGIVATAPGRGTFARTAESVEREASDMHRQIRADASLAAAFSVEIGTALIECERIKRRAGQTEEVIRSYRLAMPE
ncbi:GntR family transcriptional regulator [Micromonospora sp. HUAS LYJ1]|uniref:GntR family transcriptional regulator n=1 Tax=Micromonospora sp. HUAS LYJ1 TaxID=3061626 RepID=UPI002673E7EC|nr:GntR family transcriptional regulator [Micromonospora sp. HUAS LYJ1]WKU03143.1 GntR family transcriptional regulator [Micromonospora sp. HUAS LYJ1]